MRVLTQASTTICIASAALGDTRSPGRKGRQTDRQVSAVALSSETPWADGKARSHIAHPEGKSASMLRARERRAPRSRGLAWQGGREVFREEVASMLLSPQGEQAVAGVRVGSKTGRGGAAFQDRM